jgi:2-phosphosulfolactate phosphatase
MLVPLNAGGTVFAPWSRAQVHIEWGMIGARQAADRGDVAVIVDVLSFSTEIVLAVAAGKVCLVYSDAELEAMGGIEAAAAALDARPHRRFRRFGADDAALPATGSGPSASGERVLFRSSNGASCTGAAEAAPELLIGSFRNARACAGHVTRLLASRSAHRVTLVACGSVTAAEGERRFRPALEDWLAAGQIAAYLASSGLVLSPEAHAAACGWPGSEMLSACVAANALIEADLDEMVELALAIDCTDVVPARLASDLSGRVFTSAAIPAASPNDSLAPRSPLKTRWPAARALARLASAGLVTRAPTMLARAAPRRWRCPRQATVLAAPPGRANGTKRAGVNQ